MPEGRRRINCDACAAFVGDANIHCRLKAASLARWMTDLEEKMHGIGG
jgi:hypothetical protein